MTRIDKDLDKLHKLIMKLNVLDDLEISIKKDREDRLMTVRLSTEWENTSHKGYRHYKTSMNAVEDITAGIANDWIIIVTESQRVRNYFVQSELPSM